MVQFVVPIFWTINQNFGPVQPRILGFVMIEEAPARLREERQRLGLSQVDFGKLGSVSKNTQLSYESGASPIPLDYLGRVEMHGVDIAFIVTGVRKSGTNVADQRMEYRPAPLDVPSDTVQLAEYNVAFGLGASYIHDTLAEAAMRTFSRSWIRQFTPSPFDALYWATGNGPSMSPQIQDNDVVLIDTAQRTPRMADQFWAIERGGLGSIKALRPGREGSIRIVSINPDFEDEEAFDGEMAVIGRVVAIVRKV